MILLSICIPTYNRMYYLKEVLESIVSEEIFLKTKLVEIIISDNCSTDDTQALCNKYCEKYGDKIKYYRQSHNIHDENFIKVLHMANGQYAKLNNDTLVWHSGALGKAVNFLQSISEADVVFFANGSAKKSNVNKYNNLNDLLTNISFFITWIGGLCVNTKTFAALEDPGQYSYLMLAQVDIICRIVSTYEKGVYVCNEVLFYVISIPKKGGYSVAEIFGKNYMYILQSFVKSGHVSPSLYQKEKKNILLKHIVEQSFDSKYSFNTANYLSNLKEWHGEYYFYISFLKAFKLKLLSPIKIKIKHTLAMLFSKRYWRKRNKTNNTYLIQNGIDMYRLRQITVIGSNTTGLLDVVFDPRENFRLIIGKNCVIGKNVKFLLSVNKTADDRTINTGPIIIKNNVQIGEGSVIYPNIVISSDTIIPANSVVKDDR